MISTTTWPGVLEVAQLAQHHGVAEVDVRRGRVDAELHAQRTARGRGLLEPLLECALGQAIDRVACQGGRLRPGGFHPGQC